MEKAITVKKEKAQLHMNTIVIVIILLIVIAVVLVGTKDTGDYAKDVLGIYAPAPEDEVFCEDYEIIDSKDKLTELIYHVWTGACAKDPNKPFNFTVTTTLDFPIGKAAGEHFCGTKNITVDGNPKLIRFGDVEWVKGEGCRYVEKDAIASESQKCDPDTNSDLVINAPEHMAPDKSFSLFGQQITKNIGDCTGGLAGYAYCAQEKEEWCIGSTCWYGWGESSHLARFKIKPSIYSGMSWAIKRTGEDVVLCYY